VTGLVVAVQFLTRLPLATRHPITTADLGRSMRWFPLVGMLIGAAVALVDAALSPVVAPPVRAVIVVVLLAAITGALHLDGLMDTCDAIFAFTTPERRLEIMRDSRVGSFAIVGAASLLLLKYTAILALPVDRHLEALVAMGGISRWAMVYATARYPSARAEGLGASFRETVGGWELAWASATALVAALAAGPVGLLALLAAWAATVAAARYTMAKIPGLSGDVYGAICEGTETLVAVLLPPLWRALGV